MLDQDGIQSEMKLKTFFFQCRTALVKNSESAVSTQGPVLQNFLEL